MKHPESPSSGLGPGRTGWRAASARAVLLVVGAVASGCAGGGLEVHTFLPPIFRSAEQTAPRPALATSARAGKAATTGPASWAERALKARGLRFGTDGTPEALFAYVRFNHRLVPAREARTGDLVFFNLSGRGCGDHIGIVEAVDPTGRITFRERREGTEDQRSFVYPEAPTARRDQDGRVLNSFLRPKRMYDPPGTRYFAGEMLCAMGRVKRGR